MDLNLDFFNIKNDKVVRAGRVLISEPFLSDDYFKRSVVYLTEHTLKGSVGFVLNKALDMGVSDIMDGFDDLEMPVSLGGPVATDTIHYIHTAGDLIPESLHIGDGVYWGGDFEAMRDALIDGTLSKDKVRFFLGYSGWTENQLDSELAMNAWLVGEIPPKYVMKGGDSKFWTEVLSTFNPKYKVWANFPEDPSLN